MKFEDRVFIMRGDQPSLNAVGLNIPEFKVLWINDTSDDKSQYAKELAFVYHMCTYRSPYYDVPNKKEAVCRDYFGDKNYKISKRLTDAMRAFDEKRNVAEMRALDAESGSCDMIAKDIKEMEMESSEFNKLIKEIDAEIKGTKDIDAKIKLMESKMKLQKQKLEINDMIIGLGVKLEKQIESLKNLRERVTKQEYNGEMSQVIDSFLVDDIVDELRSNR